MSQIVHRRSLRMLLTAVGMAALCTAPRGAGATDAITVVDQSLLAALRKQASPPPAAARNIAMVGIAMYDAVSATTGLFDQPFSYSGPAMSGLSPDAAAYAAGYAMLSGLFPTMTSVFQTQEASALAGLGLSGAQLSASVAFGTGVGNSFYSARATDGSATAQTPYTPGTQPGAYQFTAAGQTTVVLPGWGNVTPFAMSSIASVLPPPLWGAGTPYANEAAYLASPKFLSDLAVTGSTGCTGCGQTEDQLELSAFWADTNGNAKFASTATPSGQWLDITDTVAENSNLDLLDTARVTAMVGTSMADAGIASWDVKDTSDFWRPDTAMHFYGNTSWKPLWPDPQFQSYISGHSSFSSAAATTLKDFFGTDDVSFCSTADPDSHDASNQPLSTTPNPTPLEETYSDPNGGSYTVTVISPSERCYSDFSSAAYEAGYSRVVGGIHFPSDNVEGLATGAAVAAEVVANAFAVAEPSRAGVFAVALAILLMGRRAGGRAGRNGRGMFVGAV